MRLDNRPKKVSVTLKDGGEDDEWTGDKEETLKLYLTVCPLDPLGAWLCT